LFSARSAKGWWGWVLSTGETSAAGYIPAWWKKNNACSALAAQFRGKQREMVIDSATAIPGAEVKGDGIQRNLLAAFEELTEA